MSQIIARGRRGARPAATAAAPAPPPTETPVDVIIKLIPVEVMTLYTTALALEGVDPIVLLAVGAVLTPLVLYLDGRRTHQPVPPAQYVIKTLAFIAWAFTISQPLGFDDAHRPVVQRWIPALAVLVIPLVGSFAFPPAGPDA